MTDFHDVAFPLPLAFGARGGPSRHTDIIRLASGHEHRNSPHAHSRRRYDAGVGVKSLNDIDVLMAFFEARGGQRHAFRFRDPMDHQSGPPGATLSPNDQDIGVGDGIQTEFQLIKAYADAAGTYERVITKPVSGTVLVAIDGVLSGVTLEVTQGVITFDVPPPQGVIISAGFQFDVPVRFDTASLDISLEAYGAGQALNIPLIEVLSDA